MKVNHYLRQILVVLLTLAAAVIICSVLSGCVTSKEASSHVENRKMETIVSLLDSLTRQRTVVQQDSSWRELVMRQFQSIREKSDTSRTLITDTAGKVIRERIVINNTREVTSETDRHEREVLIHRLEVMDSTVQAQSLMISHMDSLIQQSRKEVVKTVETPTSWWQQIQIWLGRLVLVALAVLAAVIIFRKKILWHFMKR